MARHFGFATGLVAQAAAVDSRVAAQLSQSVRVRAVSQGSLGRVERLRRDVTRSIHSVLARAPFGARGFERLLGSALSDLAGSGGGFSIGVSIARAHLREALEIEVASAAIDQRLSDWVEAAGRRYNVNDYFLGAGDWSEATHSFKDSSVAQEAVALLECGLEYRRTEAYRQYLERLAAGQPVVRNRVPLASPELVNAYFDRFVALFRSIESRGLVRIADARNCAMRPADGARLRKWRTEAAEKDIGIAIGPCGEVLRLPGGQHRTAIALVLGIPRLPVEVRLVHIDWLRRLSAAKSVPVSSILRNGFDLPSGQ